MATEPLFTSIAVAYYVNVNPRRNRICPYCRAILGYLNARPGTHNGRDALIATKAVLVGADIYFKLSPKQHVRCWCDWIYRVIPISEIGNVLTDDDITYDELFRQLGKEAQKAAGEDKQPYWYREELRLRRRERQLTGVAFLAGAGIGLLASTFKQDDYDKAKKRIRELRRKEKPDAEIVKVVLAEYPDKSGLKALKDFGYL